MNLVDTMPQHRIDCAPTVNAPRIHLAAQAAARLLPSLGGKGVAAIAVLAEVSVGQASAWLSRKKPVPLKRAMLIEINSGHRIRAEDLLPVDEAASLICIRRASRMAGRPGRARAKPINLRANHRSMWKRGVAQREGLT